METNNTDNYCQQKHINNLDALANTMKDIKHKLQESCSKDFVSSHPRVVLPHLRTDKIYYCEDETLPMQAHLLHIDLATQFNPFVMKTVQEAQDSCEKCKQATEDNNSSSK